MSQIQLRPATVADAVFIARGFHMAMLYDDVEEERIRLFAEKICVRDDVLYSWCNTSIAELDGTPVGMTTAYDGSGYHDMRVKTMSLVKEHLNVEFPGMEDEAVAGEFYIDSLAVLPEHRGKGLGKALLRHAISNGNALGLTVTLAVDPVNGKAQELYQSLGFRRMGDLFIFGHTYWKMGIPAT